MDTKKRKLMCEKYFFFYFLLPHSNYYANSNTA